MEQEQQRQDMSWSDNLPIEALELVFQKLELGSSHQKVPLVCKRWRTAWNTVMFDAIFINCFPNRAGRFNLQPDIEDPIADAFVSNHKADIKKACISNHAHLVSLTTTPRSCVKHLVLHGKLRDEPTWDVPTCLQQLTQLHTLKLTGLRSLTANTPPLLSLSCLSSLPRLQKLKLRPDDGVKIEGLSCLTQLTSLQLHSLYSSAKEPLCLNALTRLSSLKLENCTLLKTSREQLCHLRGLTRLELMVDMGRGRGGWHVTQLQCLKNLQHLSLQCDKNNQPDVDLTEATALTCLELTMKRGRNCWHVTQLQCLKNLQHLSLECDNDNQPDVVDLTEATALTYLTVRRRTQKIKGLSKLTGLVSLDCSENREMSTLESLAELTRLTHIDFTCCKLTELPGLAALTGLVTLKFVGNNIEQLPDELFTMSRLQTLLCRYNRLPEAFIQKLRAVEEESPRVTWPQLRSLW